MRTRCLWRRPSTGQAYAAPIGSAYPWETPEEMGPAIVYGVFVVLVALFVGGLFVWAAIKDGEEDKAVQARLGIRRKTRLGR